jgi:hypothetical protein
VIVQQFSITKLSQFSGNNILILKCYLSPYFGPLPSLAVWAVLIPLLVISLLGFTPVNHHIPSSSKQPSFQVSFSSSVVA